MDNKYKDIEEYLQKLCDESVKMRPFEEVWEEISVTINAEKNQNNKEKNK
ncbi:MAG: hypothetical protein IJX16_02865 [Clostridia bacterium]|nr:hypothetical protein [Clostridia bacterium]